MEAQDSYSFPLYHRIGQVARPIIASRYWIVIVLVVAILLYIPFLFSGFFQDDYGFRLASSPDILEKYNISAEVMRTSPLNLYGFSWDASERFSIEQDHGFAPWWASDQIRTNFFRPLSSLTLALDFSLWPDTPLLMHLHSLLWFGLLIILAYRLYQSISGSAVVAGLSILLLVVDDVLSGPVGWICNRHAVIAMVFCVLCVWLYSQGVTKQKWAYIAGACGVYVLALLASEMGLVTFAYLFAYLLVLDRDKWLDRAKRIIPFILVTVVWRLVYTGLGYGATGTLLYIDPLLNPVDFITQLLIRFPVLLFSAIGLPVADVLISLSQQGAVVAAVVFLIPLGLLAVAAYPVLKSHRTSAFWLLGLLATIVPLVSGIPQNRNLGLVSLGVMGLAGQLFVDVAARKPGSLVTFQRVLLKITTPILLILYLVISPISVIANPATTQTMAEEQARAADFGSAPELAEQHLYVINPPGTMSFMAGLFQRLFTDEPFPVSINYLSSGFAPVHIERVDAQTIIVTPEGGYTPLPGTPIPGDATGMMSHFSLQNVYRAMDGFHYNPHNPMQIGQVVVLSEVTVEVAKMTVDGRIAQAVFMFDHSLDDDRYVWLLWNEVTSAYETAQMPPVGESRVYP